MKYIIQDKALFASENIDIFSAKTYVVGTHYKRLDEALLMRTHNIYIRCETRKYYLDTSSYLELCEMVQSFSQSMAQLREFFEMQPNRSVAKLIKKIHLVWLKHIWQIQICCQGIKMKRIAYCFGSVW